MARLAYILCVLVAFGALCVRAQPCATDLDCNDNNLCTNDTCDTDAIVHVCKFVYNDLPCNDGNPCTCNDRCLRAQCHGDQIVSGDCRPPGKYVLETWIFVLLATVALVSVLLLVFMMCLRFIAPPERPYGSAYGYSQQY